MNRNEWQRTIQTCQEKAAQLIAEHGEITEKETAVNLLIEEIPAALARSLALYDGSAPLAVLFSGGVDSTFLCYLLQQAKIDFLAVTIGFQDNPDQKLPDDILVARQIAKKYGFLHIEKIYDFAEVEKLFKETVHMLGSELTNAVNVGVGSVELAAIQTAREHNKNITHFLGGLGSEEIYAGYKRHDDATDITAECWKGLFGMFERDLLRDQALAQGTGVTWLAPFLDPELIVQSMRVSDQLKITGGLSKVILRDTALALGLQEEYALRPKKAAQYGSRTDRAIEKLAKKHSFTYKKDYLASLL